MFPRANCFNAKEFLGQESKSRMSAETVSPERLAILLHHYSEALAPDFGLRPSTSPDWEDLSQAERNRMVAATRLALLDLLLYEGQLSKWKNLNSNSPQRREADRLAAQVRVIRIVTSNQGNGDSKTTTAATLAKEFAEQGMRVLIIDKDRQGFINTILRLKPEYGLFNFAIEELRCESCIVAVSDNIHVTYPNQGLSQVTDDWRANPGQPGFGGRVEGKHDCSNGWAACS
jgi:hypothetical protein